jgi:hypothetical protein
MSLPIGKTQITSSGVVGTSGKPMRIYGAVVRSAGTAATVALYDGTSTSGTTKYEDIDGAINSTVRVMYAGGLLFNSGCYASIANATYVTFILEQEGS